MTGKMKKSLRYNMLNVLEGRLRYLYEVSYQSGDPKYMEIQNVKKKIETIRDDFAEVFKIQARMKDLQCGEKISKYIIEKQKGMQARKLLTCIKDRNGKEVTSKDAVQELVTNFYADLYQSKVGCPQLQQKFLSFLTCKLDENDRESLNEDFSKTDISKVPKTLKKK